MVVARSISFIVLASLEVIPLLRRVPACCAAISSVSRSLLLAAPSAFSRLIGANRVGRPLR